MRKIAVLGANPACQKTLFFPEFRYGEVNRAARMEVLASGKGINFCRAAAHWGRAAGVLMQFTGGETGRFIREALAREHLAAVDTVVAGTTRCCVTCLDETRRVMTELIEPSAAVSESEAEDLLGNWREALTDAAAAAICGTLPDGSDYRLYRRAADLAHAAGKPLLFDAWQELEPCLRSGDNLLKINRSELAKLTGISDLRAALSALFRRCRLRFAAITDGADRAFASDGTNLYTYEIPRVPEVVNPIGCGDTASAVLLSEIVSGTEPPRAFQLALGAASANCMTSRPGSFDRAAAERFAVGAFSVEKLAGGPRI